MCACTTGGGTAALGNPHESLLIAAGAPISFEDDVPIHVTADMEARGLAGLWSGAW
jgi:hypothetical protein